MSIARVLGFAAVAILAVNGPVAAQGPTEPLRISVENLSANREATAGRSRSHDRIVLGDTLQYTLTFTNRRDAALRNVSIVDPLPKGMSFVRGSASSDHDVRIEYSIDGGTSFHAQPMIEVVEDGRKVQRPAAPESYTHIRWTVLSSLNPGASAVARLHARFGR